MSPRFRLLQNYFRAERARLQATAAGAEPEGVLVLEIVGTVDDFQNAVRRVDGLEWLAEWDEPEIEADDDFYVSDVKRDETMTGRLFLVMSNQAALDELLRLWNRFKRAPDEKLDHGLNKSKAVFRQLKDVRRWDASDRLRETGVLQSWGEYVAQGVGQVRFEAELWFRANDIQRARAVDKFRALVTQAGGVVLTQVAVPQIRYHGVLADLPSAAAQRVLQQDLGARWVQCDDVMFFRPTGQSREAIPDEAAAQGVPNRPVPPQLGAPVVALLDGLPLANHVLLNNRLEIDDPDGWGANYPARQREHGTAMASVILHGDLGGPNAPLSRRLYVRPVMRPGPNWLPRAAEEISRDELVPDLFQRVVARMLVAQGTSPAVAPSVRVINVSLGNAGAQFAGVMSPWARMLDWLSFTHGVLFVVSAGNQLGEYSIPKTAQEFNALAPDDREAAFVRAMSDDARRRSLLSPAESINALTVGALHADAAAIPPGDPRVVPYVRGDLPSPITSLGLGYRRSVKPDVVFPGGRQLFSAPPAQGGAPTPLELSFVSNRPPGVRAASPGSQAGQLDATRYGCGTSTAAALASRAANQIFDALEALRADLGGDGLDVDLSAVMIKALLAHSASWGEVSERFAAILGADHPRSLPPRFVGYGLPDVQRAIQCATTRATLIRSERIRVGESHVYNVPLPPSLSGRNDWRRVTVTLAWLTPINAAHRDYRSAALSFDAPTAALLVDRTETPHNAARRGTLQHEVLEGEQAAVFVDGDRMAVQVDCRAEAGGTPEDIPYAVAVTVEVKQNIAVPVYDEIRARVRPAVRVRPRSSA